MAHDNPLLGAAFALALFLACCGVFLVVPFAMFFQLFPDSRRNGAWVVGWATPGLIISGILCRILVTDTWQILTAFGAVGVLLFLGVAYDRSWERKHAEDRALQP
jgi:hypothetical protein